MKGSMSGSSTAPDDDFDPLTALGALVGKTPDRAGGTMNLLLSHMLDTAAVAEVIWDRYLARRTRHVIDEIAGGTGRGRSLFTWLCGIHDCGKATPAFQRRLPTEAGAVRAAGLRWHEPTAKRFEWQHGRAGAHLLQRLLTEAQWPDEHIAWVWPLVAGHHGFFPVAGSLKPPSRARGQAEGDERWAMVQRALVRRLTDELGLGTLTEITPALVPTRATQLQLSGLLVMADWIASGERHFPGLADLTSVSCDHARERAARAWTELGLRGGWGDISEPTPDTFDKRFDSEPRPLQALALDTAGRMESPGLLIVEGPTGEGKTWAALMAAEMLAARFGTDGVFVGMPTWSTNDPMFREVRRWVSRIDPSLAPQVALLHGKKTFNKDWSALLSEPPRARLTAFGECGEAGEAPDHSSFSQVPADWFFGYARGLLCPFVVGPLDQLLFATIRTKFVMLRMAGLLGKVVVLDEIHATDVYTSQFLLEGLRWFGQAGVPVVLLSATLPQPQRQALADAYLAGSLGREEYTADGLRHPAGYPSITAVWNAEDGTGPQSVAPNCSSRREDIPVTVELMPEAFPRPEADLAEHRAARTVADAAVADRLAEALAHGGCALVIRNSVDRAQSLYTTLREQFGDQVMLLHEQLPIGSRADRTADCLRRLTPRPKATPRDRLVVVATQVAEQAFDVDVDLLITDVAPIDLLLQRIGRLHRGDGLSRPDGLMDPRVIVTGWAEDEAAPGQEGVRSPLDRHAPLFLARSESLYGRYPLLRAFALVCGAATDQRGWNLPGDIPALVTAAYSGNDDLPVSWRDVARASRWQWEAEQRQRAAEATRYVLTRRGDKEGATLAGLHFVAVPPIGGDKGLAAFIRDRDHTSEAVLLTTTDYGYRTLSGIDLPEDGAVEGEALVDDILATTVDLPTTCGPLASESLTAPPGWKDHPRLKYSRALLIKRDGTADVSGRRLRYDRRLGLVDVGPLE